MSKITEVLMPLMGEGVHEATLTNWLVKEGEKIDKDRPLLELSTDKVDTEIPAPASGYLARILVQTGTVVKVGQVLAQISEAAGAVPGNDSPEAPAAAPKKAAAKSSDAPATKSPVVTGNIEGPLRSSPLVRKIAKEQGIDLAQVKGSGMHGRITKKDILDISVESAPASQALTALPTAPAAAAGAPQATADHRLKTIVIDGHECLEGVPVRRETMSRMRQLIADHMVESVRVSPHVTTVFEMDLHQIWNIREKHKNAFEKSEGFKLTLTPFFIHAAVQAIKKHPIINTSVDGSDILWKKDINIGCAVALENGLIVPVIKQAQDLSLHGIARRLNDLVARARSKKLKPDDVQGGTFSITNPGGWGSITSNPIINQPQVAILGIGAAIKRPVVVDDMIAIRPMMLMSLTFDHRVIDGEGGSKYLATLKNIIENYDSTPF